jgi:DNA excision repair protein ERCC-5
MKSEIINLIQLFGIPYVNAVAEAEAQCAALEELGLVDGIVTEDSDVFVFGGKTVYKNMFDDQKYVEIYKANDAAKEMSLGRNQMVALAMLLGGDYTEGVKGVGIVNAMEVLQAFDMSKGVKPGLLEFRKWLDGFDPSDADSRSSSMDTGSLSGIQKFHSSHKSARARWEMPSNFPADHILNAYLNPVVDKSTQRFSWGVPDVDNLVHFCARNIGWEASETKRMLDPIMKRLQNGMRQTRLDVFMNYSDNIQFADIRSKRLQSVFKDIQKDQQNESTEE